MTDSLVHYAMFDYKARCAVAVTTETLREAQLRHGLDPLTTIAVGRALSCAALLASTLKQGKEYVHLSFRADGIVERVVAECNGDGECRGYATPARILDALPEGGTVPDSVGEALGGQGLLTVTRAKPGDAAPYHAVSALLNGEIAADVARFLTESEQIPSAVAAGVKLSPEGEVLAAGGVLVQRLGGAAMSEELLTTIETRMSQVAISDRLAQSPSTDDIVSFLAGGASDWHNLSSRVLRFQCTCTRDKMAAALIALGESELRAIERETGKLEVSCHYCTALQTFRLDELIVQ